MALEDEPLDTTMKEEWVIIESRVMPPATPSPRQGLFHPPPLCQPPHCWACEIVGTVDSKSTPSAKELILLIILIIVAFLCCFRLS